MKVALGHQQITCTDNTTPHPLILPAAPTGNRVGRVDLIVISVETQDVRYLSDGTLPTSSLGVRLPAGSVPFIFDGNLNAIQFCAVVAGAVINVEFYRTG